MIDFIEDECLGITIPNISQFNLFYHSNATLFKPRINYKKPYEFISRFRQFFRHCIRSVFVLRNISPISLHLVAESWHYNTFVTKIASIYQFLLE